MRHPDAFPPDPRLLVSTPDRTPPAIDLTVSVRSLYFRCLINWVHSKISKQKFMFPDSRFSGQLVLDYV